MEGYTGTSDDEPTDRRLLLTVRYLWGDEGITTQLRTLVEGLVEKNWQIALVTGVESSRRQEKEHLRWLVNHTEHFYTPFPSTLRPSTLPSFLSCLRRFNQIVREFDPSIIHTYSLSLTPYLFLNRLLTGVEYISSCRIEPSADRTDVTLGSLITRIFDNYMGEATIAISSEMKQFLQNELNVPEERIRLVLNGIDTTYYRPPSDSERNDARRNLGLEDGERTICLVGRLDWIKGHDVLFKAVKTLENRDVDVIALCAGEGGHEKKIKSLAAELDVEHNVRFLGYTDPRPVYWASDIIVLPSRREGFANVIAEAMLCGTVPIRTPAAGASDQIAHGDNGYVFPFDDHDTLADYIEELFSNPSELRQMSKKSTQKARRLFSQETMVEHIEDVYRTALQ